MDLKGRNFLTLKDFTPEEITYLLDLAADLKEKKKNGVPVDHYHGKNIALIFEKTSTRTRCSFEVAAHDLGIGSCWIHRAKEVFESEEGKEILKSLGIEGDYEGIGNCILGYADGEAPLAKPRKNNFVYWVK